MVESKLRPTVAVVDLDRVESNAAWLAKMAYPSALCAVVKANAYGHGAVPVAKAALRGGASWLAVAVVEEGIELREAGIEAPILVLSEGSAAGVKEALRWDLVPSLYTDTGLRSLCEAALPGTRAGVAIKIDTGMGRVGVDPAVVAGLARSVAESDRLDLLSVWTHLAVADDPDDPFTSVQLARFDKAVASIRSAGIDPGLLHAANSAASTRDSARYDMVRCGLALYGYSPSPALAGHFEGIEPALSLYSRIGMVKVLEAGERPSYGRRRPLSCPSVVATVPIGYADGVPWRLFPSGDALVAGRRCSLAGSVTMDQIVLDCGPPGPGSPSPGDEVVLLGRQGSEMVDASEWAQAAGTITYEILTGIGGRVPRRHVGRFASDQRAGT